MSQLPDATIYLPDGSRRANRLGDHLYVAVSAWSTESEAKATAQGIRAAGGIARTTQERRPLRAFGFDRRTVGTFRPPKTARFMWLVWSCSDEPAHAEISEEEAARGG